MKCEDVRQHLELTFGSDDPSGEIRNHLETCSSCQAYRDELTSLTTLMGNDEDFYPTEAEIHHAINAVTREVDQVVQTEVIPVRWMWYLSRVAAVVLIVAVSYASYMIGHGHMLDTREIRTDQISAYLEYDNGSMSWLMNDENDELEPGVVDLLIQDLGSRGYFQAGEMLLDDISDEEMEWLKENLSVGGLL